MQLAAKHNHFLSVTLYSQDHLAFSTSMSLLFDTISCTLVLLHQEEKGNPDILHHILLSRNTCYEKQLLPNWVI